MTKWLNQYTHKIDAMLNFAMAKIKSVPYKVSLRWLYYQCIQSGYANKTRSGWVCFSQQVSRERKRFRNGWTPDILTDSIRKPYFIGHESHDFSIALDTIKDRECYVQIWYEAEAMTEQFLHFTNPYRVSLVAFRGDISIPMKWQIAKYLEGIHKEYPDKPIKILYFGDYDKKGIQIMNTALKDIRSWCNVDFDFERVGLSLKQAKAFNLPDNPNKPNTFQWESLDDKQAGELIINAMAKYIKPIDSQIEKREKEIEDALKAYYDEIA